MHDENLKERIAANLAEIRRNVAAACARAGRRPDGVTLVAATKTVGTEAIRAALACGVTVLGENRVQEAREKFAAIGNAAEWHLIGPLQKNKVKYIFDIFSMVHSVDSVELAEEISRRAAVRGVVMPVLLEVNIGEEANKHGVAPRTAVAAAAKIAALPNVRLRGLMAVPPFSDNPEASRPHFARLRSFRDEIAALGMENTAVDVLSCGMTGDYVVAVEEGATHIRIGTGIFGERKT
ncbi:MAG: YggS family pyridoxal phosphate-dependent enzyme [Nitrospinae bacterium]|nr:YggS family pyridoxal phosphate-dependent enzyme [Nitrospinota bacterium]